MLHAVIMAGGSGTRLWPESRKARPKQLLELEPGRTMLQATVDRLGDLVTPERTLIATTSALAGLVHEQLSHLPRESIVAEPCPRNTAPCIALAAMRILRDDPHGTMAVMPADHVIEPPESFRAALGQAATLVEEKPTRVVTFGIRPTYAAESFGYIERGELLGPDGAGQGSAGAFEVRQFREKPDAATARRYLEAGTFFWNAGIFVWKARTIWEALSEYQPTMHAHLARIAAAIGTPGFAEVLQREFALIAGQSIDYAVMERHPEVVMIEAPFRWDDVGSWRSLERLRPTDAAGNIFEAARHVALESSGSIVRASDPKHLVALVGAKNLIVIVTPDATLVADKEHEESVRALIVELKHRGWEEYL